ncbi:heterokaryon incompatibility protein-domain-containing protein [Colletotrichum godetiae]|uniref:Heterokaryon incompatibility protein-domain-containing protein n=1 Tax=Colletotrichum godetiae TaxID=1209918 RepID=A0AAJ0ANV5_9PEZI|nr:heterokaryon incompatibility protein-domain-containing protein [Colletotrichum godetiae]KAK1675797.1 heterokaryon incompatibility protein-domain-containing protein [Colletotrichum godetiae]
MSTYAYEALPDPRKYRTLLKLLPACNTEPEKLRAELRRQEARILWIDAICINQTDDVEKGHQVASMDLVYRSQSLVIWLREWSENSDIALDLLQSFRDCFVANGHEEFAWYSPLSDQVAKAGERFGESQTDETWAAFVDLINRPWFSRRWAVQEVVLSSQKHAHLGNRIFRLGYLVWLCGFLKLKSYHLRKELPEYSECRRVRGDLVRNYKSPAPLVDSIDTIYRVWRANSAAARVDKSSLTLERLLDNFLSLDSFDARDGICAFLSMASDIDTEEWFSDYSDQATTTEIYAKATLHIIQKNWSFSLSVNRPSSWRPYHGIQTINFTPDHSHRFKGYNTISLTTFGQPLSAVRSGQEGHRPKFCPGRNNPRCREKLVCDGCHSKIHGTGYECVDCEKLDFCYKCIDRATIEHNPTRQFRAHKNAVYFASGHSIVSVRGYASLQANLRDACSKSKNHLPFVVRGLVVDEITNIGLGGIIQRRVNGFRVDLPWENWTQLLELDQVNGLESGGTKNAAFLKALVGNRLLLEGERGVSHLAKNVMDM